jgi:hypothetical protein
MGEVLPVPVAALPERSGDEPGRRHYRKLLQRSIANLAQRVGRPEARDLDTGLGDEGLVNEAADRLSLSSGDRYELLTMNTLRERYVWVLTHIAEIEAKLELLSPFRRETGDPRWN